MDSLLQQLTDWLKEMLIFQNSFKLGARMMLGVMEK